MNIHEHQAKEIFKQFDIPVPKGVVIFDIDNALLDFMIMKKLVRTNSQN